ncbi:arginine biosynthesis bifunctional protein ArgJ [Methanolacinia petrolearia DSM 11571]|uniref:Glutamate N-acetyltransferase n=1 Tax=Methanolacinia petrolearia (strain DSM 11571 / OCM 486 / SEBR 4847) TaxID=679926 RepID=E1RFP8_METP4|nr:bifunctional ornithine acetyltransferase/N-acetylglutamate synthase [Methanolacinia petrolearia]ADN37352.1 arginine biosynthesis bifunctional protein ArgJ [Methanolacinia petrolearia DSM 11571]
MKSICEVEGVEAAGIKEGKFGLALIKASGNAAAVFTKNLVIAEPVRLMQKTMEAGRLDGIIVNSGNANVFTGEQGYRDAERMAAIAAEALGTKPEFIGVASTGVIGRYLHIDIIEDQCRRIKDTLASDEKAGDDAAGAIMTTDLYPKRAIARREGFTVAGITKGSGMIAPNMGTMLAFIYTDAAISSTDLKKALLIATERSFNRVVVDGDTSTNDCVFLTATGLKGTQDYDEFCSALEEVCISLAKKIAEDGEGATKFVEVSVTGAKSEEDAATVAKTIVGSPLVKTAIYGEDPNWGRIIAAAGRAGPDFDPMNTSISIGDGEKTVILEEKGVIKADDKINPAALAAAKELMKGKKLRIEFDLGTGNYNATAWGCDLTEKYVEINGKYTT